jgi:alpha-1,3/alpha-1,6-mannosyltransferase
MSQVQESKKLRIAFVHPDLGIGELYSADDCLQADCPGGAERLVVDAAVALKNRGHEVVLFTSRHDKARCFEETKDGELI